jgi:hypothetical protein
MTHFPASPGTAILSLQEDETFISIPVVGYEVIGSIAYPISVIPTGGLLKARRALLVDGFVIDRGFDIPFDNADTWAQWAKHQEPGTEPETVNADGVGSREQAEQRGRAANIPEAETAQEMAARLRKANADTMEETGPKTAKARKTFSSKSFWMKTNVNGSVEIAEIEKGYGLPRDHEGFEKIKREEFADLKRQSKAGDPVDVIEWGQDGPVEPQAVEPQQEAEVVEDDTGLV